MKKEIIIALILSTSLLATSCGIVEESSESKTKSNVTTTVTKVQTEVTTESDSEEKTTEAEIEKTQLEETKKSSDDIKSSSAESSFKYLKAGAWLASGTEGYRYYFINNDGETGSVVEAESGIGISFSYENDDDKTIFHLGTIEDNSPAVLTQTDENSLEIKWDNGINEMLKYISSDNKDSFVFYTNDELCEMSLKYYEKTSGQDVTGMLTAAQTNEDGTVTIQIYQNLGDHNSTSAWYTVDRTTASGTDSIDGKNVDLK